MIKPIVGEFIVAANDNMSFLRKAGMAIVWIVVAVGVLALLTVSSDQEREWHNPPLAIIGVKPMIASPVQRIFMEQRSTGIVGRSGEPIDDNNNGVVDRHEGRDRRGLLERALDSFSGWGRTPDYRDRASEAGPRSDRQHDGHERNT